MSLRLNQYAELPEDWHRDATQADLDALAAELLRLEHPTAVVCGLVGWLVTGQATKSTRTKYRTMLREVGPPAGGVASRRAGVS